MTQYVRRIDDPRLRSGVCGSASDRSSTTDPDARADRKSHSTASVLCYQGHVLMENRNGLVVSAVVSHANGFGERQAAIAMLDAVSASRRRSVAADKAYDTADFVAACCERGVTPHIARNDTRRGGSAIDGRNTRHITASARLSANASRSILAGARR
jgi:hypothetical protein